MSVYRTAAAARTGWWAGHWHWTTGPVTEQRGSACGDHRLAADTERPPDAVPADRRCQARGCRERWVDTGQPDDLITSAEEAPE